METPAPLPTNALYRACAEGDLGATSTAELEPIEGVVGQARAVQAVRFAIEMDVDGHNLFVLGPAGTGRRTFVRRSLTEAAAQQPTPSDWCYVNNFEETHCPRAIELPTGMARPFAAQMEDFIADVKTSLSAAFDGEDYRTRRQSIEAEFEESQTRALKEVHDSAKERSIRIMQSPSGVMFAPVRNGEVLGPDEFEKLPEADQKRIQDDVEAISKQLQNAMRDSPQRLRAMREKLMQLDNQVTGFAVGSLVEELAAKYREFPKVVEFLQSMQKDLIKNSALLRGGQEMQMPFLPFTPEDAAKRRYAVNVIVSHDVDRAAPVVIEERPAYAHLVGRIEHRAHMGALTTDFTLIRAGALHRANGGFLVLDARRLLTEPFAWDALKQALKSRCVKIESIAEAFAMSTTVALEPEPIPLRVKVVLIGDRRLYFMLQQLDHEFSDLFKIAADFDERMDRDAGTQEALARAMSAIVARNGLLPVARDGIYRLIEESARDAGDQEKLSNEIRRTEDIVREGHYWATENGHNELTAADIDAAIASREYRHGRLRERVVEEISRGTILIDTEGAKIGQINALAVHQLGDFSFGRPNRITARVSLGSGKVVDIEREAELGGSLHSKGVLILSGYIAATYGVEQPLSLAATIAFEQSYGGVDGDSASCAELYALISAIAGVPISQSFAVTGSVNQYGDVQAIGGVNEKIEGFFDICAERGLTGEQGVLIPSSNVKHLMLRSRVVDAVADGRFSVYGIDTIDQGLTILTGVPAGEPGKDGEFPSGSVHCLARDALRAMAARRREFGNSGRDGGN